MTQGLALITPPAGLALAPRPDPGPALVRLWVPGTPVPQGSKSVNPRSGGMFEANKQTMPWRGMVSSCATLCRAHNRRLGLPLKGPVLGRFVFYFHRPKSVTPAQRPYPDVPPDLDKLIRAVKDGLKGTLLTDDSQVVRYHDPGKEYGEPGCLVELWELV